MSNSIYDIKLKSWDGTNEDVLGDMKGKVTLIINVTTDCGNAPQFAIIESLYQKYNSLGFEVVAIPTNEYCGEGVTYGEWEACGIRTAEQSYKYATDNYQVSYPFTELVNSNPGAGWFKQLPEGEEPHEIFARLSEETETFMFGNFEKYLISRDGRVVGRYANGTLLDYANLNGDDGIGSSQEELARISSDIEKALVNEETSWKIQRNAKEHQPA